MDRAFVIRAVALYAPAGAAFLLARWRRDTPRVFAACLAGFAWAVVSLHALQLGNLHAKWWTFHATGGLFREMPVDMLLGWAALWGIIPVLAVPRAPVLAAAAIFLGLDLLLMPACSPVVELHPYWLAGEVLGLAVVLLPSFLFARATLAGRSLNYRAVMHVLTFSGLVLLMIPEFVFALRPGPGWLVLRRWPGSLGGIVLQGVALLGVAGVSAVQEFAQRGEGTPIPYDPPKRLVTSGLYAYLANPMQLSMSLVLMAWGGVLLNSWIAGGGLMAFVYGAGLAAWDEGDDMRARFGTPWIAYRRHVRAWVPRWTPWYDPQAPPATLYVGESCGPCSQVRRWFEARRPRALALVAAEDHPARDLERITYEQGAYTAEGVAAIARALEHINLAWAFAGACLRLPGISPLVQLFMDAAGMGPRAIARRSACAQRL